MTNLRVEKGVSPDQLARLRHLLLFASLSGITSIAHNINPIPTLAIIGLTVALRLKCLALQTPTQVALELIVHAAIIHSYDSAALLASFGLAMAVAIYLSTDQLWRIHFEHEVRYCALAILTFFVHNIRSASQDYMSYYNGKLVTVSRYVPQGDDPNSVAYIYIAAMMLMCLARRSSLQVKQSTEILFAIGMIVGAIGIALTGSRTSTVLAVYLLYSASSSRATRLMVASIGIAGFTFIARVTHLGERWARYDSDATDRFQRFTESLRLITSSPISLIFGQPVSGSHNTPLELFSLIGTPGALALYLMVVQLHVASKHNKYESEKVRQRLRATTVALVPSLTISLVMAPAFWLALAGSLNRSPFEKVLRQK